MRKIVTVAVAAMLPAACAAPVSAPAPRPVLLKYAVTGGDTLHYHYVRTATVEVATSTGSASLKSLHDAGISLQLLPGDTARAWYESLTLAFETSGAKIAPDVSTVLHKPFVLAFNDRGQVGLISSPNFPAALEGLTDLRQQFDDFFLRLPPEAPERGVIWTDTVISTTTSMRSQSTRTSVASSRIVGDSTVNGLQVSVIRTTQRISIMAHVRAPGTNAPFVSTMAGQDSGLFYFAFREGRMVRREHRGTLRGEFRPAADSAAPPTLQTYSYHSSITLAPERK